MRAKEPGQSLLLMLDVADALTARQIKYAVIGAVAPAARGMDPGLYARASQVVGREDFIAMKVFASRPQDYSDASLAIAANPESLDLELLRQWVLRFGRSTALTLETLLP